MRLRIWGREREKEKRKRLEEVEEFLRKRASERESERASNGRIRNSSRSSSLSYVVQPVAEGLLLCFVVPVCSTGEN